MDNEGVIFDIQRFSIHDGPGIRTLVFFKGCNLRCKWCSNPESQNFGPELLFRPEKCTGCLACINVCPVSAISIKEDGLMVFRREICRNCGNCALVCDPKAREMKGRKVDVQEVIKEVMKDKAFYSDRGGVTLGGGEPLARSEFAKSVLVECRKNGIHTAIETAGYVNWSSFEEVLPYTDLFLYDLKHMDPNIHKDYIGVDNSLSLSNLTRLAELTNDIIVRTPVIPGFNDQEAQIIEIAKFVLRLNIRELHLLTYHRFGEEKYRYLGRGYPLMGDETIGASRVEQLKNAACIENLIVKAGG